MRRTYTRERFLDRVALIREHVPDCAITTDIIVGFPGETEADFAADARGRRGGRLRRRLHVHLLAPARHRGGGVHRTSSSRTRCRAERMERLVEVIQRRARERAQRFVGRTLDVLVEGTSRHDAGRVRGRTTHNKVVNFDGLASPGEIVPVTITGATSQSLDGRGVAARPRRRLRPPRCCRGATSRVAVVTAVASYIVWSLARGANDFSGRERRHPGRREPLLAVADGARRLRRAGRRGPLPATDRVAFRPTPCANIRSCAGTSQTVEQDAQGRLPGYEEAVVRRFDAPEALNTRFHEVHAKSALSKVPDQARVPFSWTVNPYRGCSHSCSYCLWGATPVLMADGRTRPIEDLRVGDEIIGTERAAATGATCARGCSTTGRRSSRSGRSSSRTARDCSTSGDHRFLTERGWKHVENTPRSEPRPAAPDDEQRAPRHGPLRRPAAADRGLQARLPVRAHPRRRASARATSTRARTAASHASTASGSRSPTSRRCACPRVSSTRSASSRTSSRSPPRPATTARCDGDPHRRTRRRSSDHRADPLPILADEGLAQGLPRGDLRREGSCSEALRICNTDGVLIHWTRESLDMLGFDTVVEDYDRPNKLRVVRIRGGLEGAAAVLPHHRPGDHAQALASRGSR